MWMCIVDLCIVAPEWKPTIINWMDNRNVGIFRDNGIIFNNKTTDTCYSIDQFKKHCVKWKKPEPKQYSTHFYMKCTVKEKQ